MVKSDIQAGQMYKLKTIIGVFEPIIAIQRLLGGGPTSICHFFHFLSVRPSVRLSVANHISGTATSKTWTRTPDPEKPGPSKTWNKYRIKKYV